MSRIPVKIPFSESSLIAEKRFDASATLGSIFLQSISLAVVIVIFIRTGEWLFIDLSTSMSLVIRSLFVAMETPKRCPLINSNAPLVKRASFSKGLYGSLIAPVPITPVLRFDFSSCAIKARAFSFALTSSKLSTR